MSAQRTLATAGLWGALLTAVILAMSVLLRLGTHIEAGEAVSTLPPSVEQWARLAHRIAAMAVGLLAALALVAVVRERPMQRALLAPVACVIALTLLLASIGRYTPGYRVDLVTILNVMGGTALAAAFWWLRAPAPTLRGMDFVAAAALGLLLTLAALGAAADAAAMRGARILGPLHVVLGTFFIMLALLAAWRQRRRRGLAIAVAALVALQFVLGFVLVGATVPRPIGPGWLHAMVALALALLLVSLAVSRPVPAATTDQPGLPSILGRQ